MPTHTDFRRQIEKNIYSFGSGALKENAIRLLATLGYQSDKTVSILPNDAEGFGTFLKANSSATLNDEKALTDEWKSIDFLFQLTGDELSRSNSQFDDSGIDVSDKRIESYLFFAIELTGESYSRTKLAEITREINKVFPMPAMIVFRYANAMTLSIIDHRVHKREESKDVLGKVTLIKDIRLDDPHRAHIDILADLALENLKNPKNWVELHKEWQRVLDTKELNKKFFQELANWYFWAVQWVEFPDDEEKNHDVLKATSVIRLITRLIFVWFLKEKGLVSPRLFDEQYLDGVLNFKDDSCYYKAILQNLFFATLNSEMGTRRFIADASGGRNSQHFVHNVFRYKDEFRNPEDAIKELFEPIPFLNGGLFECLDKEIEVDGEKRTVRVDGFSQNKKNPVHVPDDLFFNEEDYTDLSEVYDDKRKSNVKVRGLINILNSYKFTVAENTPVEEEIALDPELLGRVFENLLANYNPETKTTARKQTGSFYTPREIVNYMVDESLIAYLKQKLQIETEGFGFVAVGEEQSTVFGNEGRIQRKFDLPVSNNRWNGKSEPPASEGGQEDKLELELRKLFSYTDDTNPFNETETEILIKAIDNCKILDPACGSGAFPMGILHRLVHLLSKLDRDNSKWKQWQKQKAIMETEKAFEIGVTKEREDRLIEINSIFAEDSDDYGRKLFLIENCIYGVDIQPIAIQIAKLRFFISLIVDQKAGGDASNNLGIRPLPNLETKFVAANTLIGLEAQGGLRPTKVNELEKDLKEVRAKHFGARSRETKKKYREKDKEIRLEIADLLKQGGIKADVADQIAEWNPYVQNASAGWFDAEYMFGIEKGFDIIIANPPYLKERDNKSVFQKINASALGRKYHQGKMDYWYYFMHRSIDLLSSAGRIAFITSRYWIASSGATKLIGRIRTTLSFTHIVDIGALKVFENVAGHHMVHIYRNSRSEDTIQFRRLQNILDDISSHVSTENCEIGALSNARLFANQRYEINLSTGPDISLRDTVPLGSVFHVTQGVVQNPDKVSTAAARTYGLPKGDGVFVLKKAEFERLDLQSVERKFVKEFFSESDIKKFSLDTREPDFLLYVTRDNCPSIETYPNLRKHLAGYRVIMENRRETANGTIAWFQLHWPRRQEYFENPKVVLPSMFAYPVAAYCTDKSYFGMGTNVISALSDEYNLKYLTAILNSQLANWWFKRNGKQRGTGLDIGVDKLRLFPIKRPEASTATELLEAVNRIIEVKMQHHDVDTSNLEAKIDELVYKLYGLTDEEIAVVEGR